jgi:hypothetical protein
MYACGGNHSFLQSNLRSDMNLYSCGVASFEPAAKPFTCVDGLARHGEMYHPYQRFVIF